MQIRDKVVLFLGDSITQGVGAGSVENRYTDVFARNTGATSVNYGLSGTRIAHQINFTPGLSHDRDFIMRVDEMQDTADMVVVFGGTNDFGHGDAPLGDFGDRDQCTFYGALHTLITKLVNKYPEARIVFMTPLHRFHEESEINCHGNPLSAYVNAIREVCEYYSLPVLDLYANSGIQPKLDVIKEIYMPDGLHPSAKGAERIALMLEAFIKTI